MNIATKRTFIAFKVSAGREILGCMSHLRKTLGKERIKWADPSRLHVTMTFTGDAKAEQVEYIGDILRKYVPLYSEQVLRIHDLGVFRNIRNPRVLWLGIDPIPSLNELKLRIDKDLEETGF